MPIGRQTLGTTRAGESLLSTIRRRPDIPTVADVLDWRADAECALNGADPELFAPLDEPKVPSGAEMWADLYCGNCAVREQCGAFADRTQTIGLLGGQSRFLESDHYVRVNHLAGAAVTRIARPDSHRLVDALEIASIYGYRTPESANAALQKKGVVPVETSSGGQGKRNLYRLGDVREARNRKKRA